MVHRIMLGSAFKYRRFLIGAAIVTSFLIILSNPLFSPFNQFASDRSFGIVLGSLNPWSYPSTASAPIEASSPSIPVEEGPDHQPPPIDIETTPEHSPIVEETGYQEPRENAAFISLVRNGEVQDMADSVRFVEERFNRKYHYPWVFLNDLPFSEEFMSTMADLVSGDVQFGRVPSSHWEMPDFINASQAEQTREDMKNVIYGDSESYRKMCRFQSGFFYRHPLMMQYDYYWRVEPSIELYCDVDYDVFKYMRENNKKYGFTLSLKEFKETIPTLWETVREFIVQHSSLLASHNGFKFLSSNGGVSYNLCHFWSNFEIGDLNFFRSPAYSTYFDFLDQAGGFYYERWGDAPVHSIGVALLMNASDVHFFDDIGYYHAPYTHCPTDEKYRSKCSCDPSINFDWEGYSCTKNWLDAAKTS